MWNKPTKEELEKIPVFYSTEEIPLKGEDDSHALLSWRM